MFLITFGVGSEEYSNKTPSSFDFSTNHQQGNSSSIGDGYFGFVNRVPAFYKTWSGGALDHTMENETGYLYLVNVGHNVSQLFNKTANNLCAGLRYEFSAYLANVRKKNNDNATKTKVLFQVQDAMGQQQPFEQLITADIPEPEHNTTDWKKYGLSFVALNRSIVLLMISNATSGLGNDLAIDDIELRVCSTVQCDWCHTGWYIYYFKT